MPSRHSAEDDAVAEWLRRSLAERYAATLREPVPEALLKLLGDGKA